VRLAVAALSDTASVQLRWDLYTAPAAPTPVSAPLPIALPAGAAEAELCSNCRQPIPATARLTHESFCLRNNAFCPICEAVYLKRDAARHWHCPDCGELLPVADDRTRHAQLLHTPLQCPCGIALPLERMRVHRREACPLRTIVCRFCGDHVQAGPMVPGMGLHEHEAYCGSRTVDCSTCSQKVAMKVYGSGRAGMSVLEMTKNRSGVVAMAL